MICNETSEGWELIFQRAHAKLAADLVAPLRASLRPAPWTSVLYATVQHDHGWQEWEPGGRLTGDGHPQHFTDVRLEDVASQSRSLLQRVWHQDRWVALLAAHHLDHLYSSRRGEEPSLDAFLDDETAWRRTWRAELGLSEAEEARRYAPLRWGDAFSLALCCRTLDGQTNLAPGPAGGESSVAAYLPDRGALTVRPWPYERDRFTVSADAYRISQPTFESHDALIDTLADTVPTRRSWTLEAPA